MTYELFGYVNYFLIVSLTLLILSMFRDGFEKAFVVSVVVAFAYLVAVQVAFWGEAKVVFDGVSVQFYPPFWIENEKLFFWFFLSTIILPAVKGKPKEVSKLLLLTMLVLILPFQNPSDPLPELRRELELFDPAYLQFYVARARFYYNSVYMWIHPPLLFLSYAFFLHAFSSAVAKGDEYRFTRHGYLFLTLGLIFGYPWALEAWGENWWWDPKVSSSLMLWTLYTAYLHARVSGKYYRIINTSAFLSLVFTFLLTYIAPGVHAYG